MDAVESMAALTGATVTTDLHGAGEQLNPSQQTAVLRIVQEALQNVRKHAGSSHTVVSTKLEAGNWILEVSDDGRGFDVGTVAARGRRNFGSSSCENGLSSSVPISRFARGRAAGPSSGYRFQRERRAHEFDGLQRAGTAPAGDAGSKR